MLKIITQSFRMSLQNIKGNKMRSFLTMLGIVIGVAAVIGLITIVQGASNTIMGEFEKLGTDVLTVSAPGTALKKGLTDSDLTKLSQVEGVDAISPSVSLTTTAVYDGNVYKKISVSGTSVVYFLHNDVINLGRAFNSSEESGDTNVCIVDKSFVKNVLNGQTALGSTVKLGGLNYTIIGIRKDDSSMTSAYTDTSNQDGAVIIPYRNALDLSKESNVSTVSVYVADGYTSSTVEKNLRSALDHFYNEADNAYSVINMESLMDSMSTIMSLMSALLGGIASIALVVGGIGIMNMMLVSVTERTKEIGLRKALGAEPVWIQLQFLMESITLSVVGGLIGILVGLLIALVASKAMDMNFTL